MLTEKTIRRLSNLNCIVIEEKNGDIWFVRRGVEMAWWDESGKTLFINSLVIRKRGIDNAMSLHDMALACGFSDLYSAIFDAVDYNVLSEFISA